MRCWVVSGYASLRKDAAEAYSRYRDFYEWPRANFVGIRGCGLHVIVARSRMGDGFSSIASVTFSIC